MPYTIEQAREIMGETQRFLDEDARLGRCVTARAAATRKPPTAEKLFADYICDHLDDGKTLPEAIREAAIAQPNLHRAWIREKQEQQKLKEQKEREAARRARSRNS